MASRQKSSSKAWRVWTMHHPSGDCIKTGIRAFNPLFAGRSCTGMRVNRGKGGNTDTSARWEDFWVASGLSTEGEGRSEEPRELPARREAQDPRPSTAVSVPRCHHPTLGASRIPRRYSRPAPSAEGTVELGSHLSLPCANKSQLCSSLC